MDKSEARKRVKKINELSDQLHKEIGELVRANPDSLQVSFDFRVANGQGAIVAIPTTRTGNNGEIYLSTRAFTFNDIPEQELEQQELAL